MSFPLARSTSMLIIVASVLLSTMVACGGGAPAATVVPSSFDEIGTDNPVPTPTPAPPITSTPTLYGGRSSGQTPTPAGTLTPTAEAGSNSSEAPSAKGSTPSSSSTSEVISAEAASNRSAGQVEGVRFIVTDGSEATFTVREQLAKLPLPNDAVMRTKGLNGEVRLDGGQSRIDLDLQTLTSDSSSRDRYVRRRMFPGHPSATIVFGDLRPLPDGFEAGKEVSTEVTGTLSIKGVQVPLAFEIESRDDGNTVFVLGRTVFTWDQLEMPVPTARSVISVEDRVYVEVLLMLEPRGK